MMRTRFILNGTAVICAAFAASIFTSCVHEFPDETTPAPLELEFSFAMSMDMPEWVQEESKADASDPTDAAHDVRYVVSAYRQLNTGGFADKPLRTFVLTKDNVGDLEHTEKVDLEEGTYRLLAWVDYVGHDSTLDLYYNASDLSGITVNGEWQGNVTLKDAFIGCDTLKVIRYGSEVAPVKAEFELERPVAAFQLMTTDVDKFISKMMAAKADASVNLEDYYAKISYTSYIPNTYDLVEDVIRDSKKGYTFTAPVVQLSEKEATIGFDYIMIPAKGTTIGLNLSFYDKDGNDLGSSGDIEVPLKRGHKTIIKGEFMTKEAGGGIKIDTGFAGDHNIEL